MSPVTEETACLPIFAPVLPKYQPFLIDFVSVVVTFVTVFVVVVRDFLTRRRIRSTRHSGAAATFVSRRARKSCAFPSRFFLLLVVVRVGTSRRACAVLRNARIRSLVSYRPHGSSEKEKKEKKEEKNEKAEAPERIGSRVGSCYRTRSEKDARGCLAESEAIPRVVARE